MYDFVVFNYEVEIPVVRGGHFPSRMWQHVRGRSFLNSVTIHIAIKWKVSFNFHIPFKVACIIFHK